MTGVPFRHFSVAVKNKAIFTPGHYVINMIMYAPTKRMLDSLGLNRQ